MNPFSLEGRKVSPEAKSKPAHDKLILVRSCRKHLRVKLPQRWSHFPVGKQTEGMRFGYLWWTTEYTFKGRPLRVYFASGNGGQEIVVIPDLDMVVACYGGNYSDSAGWLLIREYIPRFILPSIVEN